MVGVALAVSALTIGIVYENDYCENRLALWNIVYGGSFIFTIIITVFTTFALLSGNVGSLRCLSGFGYLVNLFLFGWFIVGNVWVYDLSYSDNQCNQVLYRWYVPAVCRTVSCVLCRSVVATLT